jgi:hypothetical protein
MACGERDDVIASSIEERIADYYERIRPSPVELGKASSISLSLPAGAFAIVQSALNWLVDNYPRSDGRSV